MLQNVNSCGEVLTPSLEVTMLSDHVASKQQCLTSKHEVVRFLILILITVNNQSSVLFEFVTLTVAMLLH